MRDESGEACGNENGVRHGRERGGKSGQTADQKLERGKGLALVQSDVRAAERKPSVHAPRAAKCVHHQGGPLFVVVRGATAYSEDGWSHFQSGTLLGWTDEVLRQFVNVHVLCL